MSEADYMVLNEKTGAVIVAGVTLDKARQAQKENPYDYRIVWQKSLVNPPQRTK